MRSEHIAVDHERLLVAEQPGEIDRAVLALKPIVADHRGAWRQRPPLRRDALDMTSQFDFLGQKSGAGGTVFGAFVGDSRRGRAGDLVCGSSEVRFAFIC